MTSQLDRQPAPETRFPPRGTLRLRRALLCFLGAYLLVTVLAGAITRIYATVNDTAADDALADSPVLQPSFADTVPYHVLVMLIVWPLFAVLYFRGSARTVRRDQLHETALLSALWLAASMIVDFIAFVLIKHPWSLTPHQFYIDYQPWITMIYAAILASPWLRLLFARPAA